MNIEDLVKLSDVMVEHSLGPNGGELLLFFIESIKGQYLGKLKSRNCLVRK